MRAVGLCGGKIGQLGRVQATAGSLIRPDSQTVATSDERIQIAPGDMRGSLVFAPDAALALERLSLVIDGAGFSSNVGRSSYVEHGQRAARRSGGVNENDVFLGQPASRPPRRSSSNLRRSRG